MLEFEKVADMAAIIEEHKPDIILRNESWLHPDIADNEVFSVGYNVFRKDRISDNHGGVFQAVKEDIIVTHRKDLNTDCEIILNAMPNPEQEIKVNIPLRLFLLSTEYERHQ